MINEINWGLLFHELFPVVCFIYILDSILWIKKYQVSVNSLFWWNKELTLPGLSFVGISPLARSFRLNIQPLFFLKTGILYFSDFKRVGKGVSDKDAFDFIKYDEIKKIEISLNKIEINDSRKINLPSHDLANSVGEKISSIKSKFADSPDYEEEYLNARNRLAIFKMFSIIFDFSSTLSFLILFVALPLIFYFNIDLYFSYIQYLLLLASLFLYNLLLIVLFKYKFDSPAFGFNKILSFGLIPTNIAHTSFNVSKYIFEDIDHLFAASLLLKPKNIIELLRKEYFINKKMMEIHAGSEIEQAYSERMDKLIFTMGKLNIAIEEILKLPTRIDKEAIGFCPSCRSEFVKDLNSCPSCKVELLKYVE
jgi:hypothetical protein